MADNTASNLGTGQGVFSGKVADDLQFKSLVAGTGITLSADSNEITINSSATISSGTNLGSGEGLFANVNSGSLEFKSITVGTGLSIANTANEVSITVDNANLNAGTLGGLASTAFLQKSDNLAAVADVSSARTNLGVYSKTESDAKYFANNTNLLPDQDNTRSIGDNSNRFSDVYAVELHGTATRAGVVTSIADHNIAELLDVDASGVANGHVLKYNGSHWVSTVDGGATNLGALSDVNSAGAANGQVLIYNSANSAWEPGTVSGGGGGGGSSTLVGLTDTPTNYAGAGGYFVKVNSGASAIEFVADPGYITGLGSLTTTDLAEGTNQYFTNARADARIAAASINDLTDVDTSGVALNNSLKWNGSAWVVGTISTDLSANTTTDLTEGTNLYYTTARANTDIDARIAAKTTDDLSEGATNLYYTTARANTDIDARLTSTGVTGAKITNWDTAYGWGDHSTAGYQSAASLTTDIDAHLNQSNPTSGFVLSWNGSDYAWVAPTAGSYGDSNVATYLGGNLDSHIIPSANVTYDLGSATYRFRDLYLAGNTIDLGGTQLQRTNAGRITWGGTDLQDYNNLSNLPDLSGIPQPGSNQFLRKSSISVTTDPANGGGSLSYDNDGGFTFEPADLSGYQTTAGLNASIDSHLNQSNPTSGYVLSWNGSDYAWVAQSAGGGGTMNDLVDDTTPQLGGTLDANGNDIDMGTNTITDAKVGQWDTAYGWGDHSTAGYLADLTGSTLTSLSDVDAVVAGDDGKVLYYDHATTSFKWKTESGAVTSVNGQTGVVTLDTDDVSEGSSNLYYTDARADARITAVGITSAKVTNWDTAYGWGDHSTAGYLTAETSHADVLVDGDFASQGIMLRGASAGSYSILTDNSANWNTAFGWGDHSTAGYQTTAGLNAAVDSHLNQSNPTAGYVLSWNGSDYAWIDNTGYTSFNTDFDTRLATKSTTDLAEGTNLYYTDARADARVNLQTGANLDLSSKSTTDQAEGTNLYYTDTRVDSRITGNWLIDEDNMASDSATKIPSQQSVKAYVDSQVASENELSEMNDVTITSVQNNDFLKYNSSTSQWENATVTPSTAAGSNTHVQFNDGGTMGGDGGFTYDKTTDELSVGSVITAGASPSLSATTHLTIETTAGNGNISLTTHGAGVVNISSDIDMGTNVISDTKVGQWDTAYGWGDHGAAGYLTAETNDLSSAVTWADVPDANITSSSVVQHQGNLTITESQISDLQSYLTAEADTLATVTGRGATTTTTAVIPFYYANQSAFPNATTYHGAIAHSHSDGAMYFAHGGSWNKMANDSQLANSTNWDTAFGWGDHSTAGYLTAETSHADVLVDGDFASQGIMLRGASAGSYSILTDNSANWNTAFGWGDHSTAGYQSASSLNSDIDSHLNQSNPTSGYVLSWNGSDYAWVAQSGGGGTLNTAGNTGSGSVNLSTETLTVTGTTGQINVDASAFALSFSLDSNINSIQSIAFEGSTADANETKLQATDPTADRTINLPDASGHLAVFATAPTAAITDGSAGQALVTDGNGALSFTTISGGSSLTVQDEGSSLATAATTLNFVGSGVVASGTGATKTITITGGGGSAGTEYEEFKINYATNGDISTISDTSSGISGVVIDSAVGGDVTVTFTGYTTPPLSVMFYGYNYPSNEYNMNTLGSTGTTLRKVPGGGSSGSPTAFGSFSSLSIKVREAETGAGRSFGTTTHAWVRFVMGA